MKIRYLDDKILDTIDNDILDIMYFIKEYMNKSSNQILGYCDDIRTYIRINYHTRKEKLDYTKFKIRAIKDILDSWDEAPIIIIKIINDIIYHHL